MDVRSAAVFRLPRLGYGAMTRGFVPKGGVGFGARTRVLHWLRLGLRTH